MKEFSISVLGTPYKCLVGKREELRDLDPELQGCCKNYSKEILVCTESLGDNANEQYNILREVVTHELCHAFLYESGLLDYSSDEKLVDWLSVNLFKMLSCFDVFMSTWDLTEETFNDIIR